MTPRSAVNPFLAAALGYGRAGWKIFPILERTKDTPLIRQWGVRASSDPKQITEWWTRWPNANIGLACGPSGIGVVDSDVPKGEETLQRLADSFEGQLSSTRTQRTPRGGIHRFYRGRLATTAGKIGPNVDTRGVGSNNGGYVLLPPSRTDKGAYKWEDRRSMAALDPWVADVCAASESAPADQTPLAELDTPDIVERAHHYLTNDAPLSRQGAGGDDALVKRVAPTLKDMGISEELAGELLAELWNDRCEPPWQLGDCDDKDNLYVKVHNGYLYCVQSPPGIDTPEADFGDDEPEPLTGEDAENAAKGEAQQAELKSAAKEWRGVLDAHVLCLNPVAFIKHDDKVALGPGQIDAAYNSLVNRLGKKQCPARYRDHAAKLAIGTPNGIKKVDGMCYRPGRSEICIDKVQRPDKPPRQVELFNMWIDPCVKPLDGDPAIFRKHMRYLIPNQRERILFLDWLSSLVQHPNEKIMYAVLIVGLERTGKSWLGYMLRKLLGDANVAMVGDEDPIGDTFNGWTENKLLGIVHELAPNPKVDLVARVKPIITEPTIQVNEKYIKRHRAENATHILAISNHDTAVRMLRNNPRWLVIRAADDPFGVDENGEATPKFDAYYKLLWDSIGPMDDPTPTDEVRRIKRWLLGRDVSKFIRSIAPATETRHEIADAAGTNVANQVNGLYRERAAPFLPDRTLVTPSELVDCLDVSRERDLKDNPLAVLNLVTSAMTALGCRKVTDLVRIGGGSRSRLWSVNRKLADKYKDMDDAAVAAIYKCERADAGVKAKAEAAEQAAQDFGEAAE